MPKNSRRTPGRQPYRVLNRSVGRIHLFRNGTDLESKRTRGTQSASRPTEPRNSLRAWFLSPSQSRALFWFPSAVTDTGGMHHERAYIAILTGYQTDKNQRSVV